MHNNELKLTLGRKKIRQLQKNYNQKIHYIEKAYIKTKHLPNTF